VICHSIDVHPSGVAAGCCQPAGRAAELRLIGRSWRRFLIWLCLLMPPELLEQLGIADDHIALTVLPHVGQAPILINA